MEALKDNSFWAIWKLCHIGRDSSGRLLDLLLLLALASALGAIALGEELPSCLGRYLQ